MLSFRQFFVTTIRPASALSVLTAAILSAAAPESRAQTLTVLHSFNHQDGSNPETLVQGADGFLYGATFNGGANGAGAVFKISTTGDFVSLHDFASGFGDGSRPDSALVVSDKGCVGSTFDGGANATGTIYTVAPDGAQATIFSFPSGGTAELYSPQNGLIRDNSGRLCGVAANGGANGRGGVFALSNGTLKTLYSLPAFDDAGGAADIAFGSDGNIYGTCSGTENTEGFLFKIAPDGAVSVLHTFRDDANGHDPVSAPLLAADGKLYGTTPGLSPYHRSGLNVGTLYRLATDGSQFETLYTFAPTRPGAAPLYPAAGLIQGADGAFYGATLDGSLDDYTVDGSHGTIYRFVAETNGVTGLSVIHRFTKLDPGSPASPNGRLVFGPDGALYGVTTSSDTGDGTVFRLAFDGPGVAPMIGLTVLGGPDVIEGGSAVKLKFTRLLGDSSQPVTIRYTVGGKAVNGVDYNDGSGQPLSGAVTIPASGKKATVKLKAPANSATQQARAIKITVQPDADGGFNYNGPAKVKLRVIDRK